jgi:hypothetical protein
VARDLTEQLQTIRRGGEYQDSPADGPRAARDFVRLAGRDTGNEHFGSVDPLTGAIVDAGTSDHPSEINFNRQTLEQLWNKDGPQVDIHHNRGGGMPESGSGLSMLAAPGVRWIVAHGIEGTEARPRDVFGRIVTAGSAGLAGRHGAGRGSAGAQEPLAKSAGAGSASVQACGRDRPPRSRHRRCPGPRDGKHGSGRGWVGHQVTILDNGVLYRGECYRSLSKVARLVASSSVNLA